MELIITPETWHGACYKEVGLWLQPGRKSFRGLGGNSENSDRAALFWTPFHATASFYLNAKNSGTMTPRCARSGGQSLSDDQIVPSLTCTHDRRLPSLH